MRLAVLLLLAANLSVRTPQRGLQAPSEPGSFLIGLTGQDVAKPIGGAFLRSSHVPLRILRLQQGYTTRNLRWSAKTNHCRLRIDMHHR